MCVRRAALFNPKVPSTVRLPKPSSPQEKIFVEAGKERFAVTVGDDKILLQREAGRIHAFKMRCTVGRISSSANDYVLDDPMLSQVHFSIRLMSDHLEVTDHRSTNGTVVEWQERLGKLSARCRENDPHLTLMVGDNQNILELKAEEINLDEPVKLGVTKGGSLIMAEDDLNLPCIELGKFEGRLRLVSVANELSDRQLLIVHSSIERFNRDRVN